MPELIKLPWNGQRGLAKVTLETVIYSPNYNLYSLVQSNFEFSATGRVEVSLQMNSIKIDDYHSFKLILYYVLFVLFALFYTSQFVISVYRVHRKLFQKKPPDNP